VTTPVILVTGATSIVGRYLLPLLSAQGYPLIAVSRYLHERSGSETWVCTDIATNPIPPEARCAETLIHLGPLPLLTSLLQSGDLGVVRRVIAIGTTSIFTKADSGSSEERSAVAVQNQAEENLATIAEKRKYHWTLFRPTLVYDGRHDKNIALIARFIARFGFFPVMKPASGLRQPLHAADLAWACATVLDKPLTMSRSYNLAGGQVLSYREMVEKVFRSLGKQPRLVTVRPWLYHVALAMIRLHPHYQYIRPEMASRMNMDMVYDFSAAHHDFGFSPRPFNLC
jgi:nucleoside-diphosphate-sugar epimerase